MHAAPFTPQLVKPDIEQFWPEQQPVGQEVASQVQLPPVQRWPGKQAAAPLHVH